MRKLFTILCVSLTISVSAQVQFGPVTGLNISAINSSQTLVSGEELVSSIGINIGGVAHFTVAESGARALQLKAGFLYSQKGVVQELSYQSSPYGYVNTYEDKVTFNLDYIEMPIEVAFVMGDIFGSQDRFNHRGQSRAWARDGQILLFGRRKSGDCRETTRTNRRSGQRYRQTTRRRQHPGNQLRRQRHRFPDEYALKGH